MTERRRDKMFKNIVISKTAPEAIGPYSQAIEINGFIFCSGQIPINPNTKDIVSGGIKEQTEQVLKNLEGVLHSEGGDLNSIVKTTVYMTDLTEYEGMNEVYGKHFKNPYPAQATVQVVKLPRNVKIEIEAVAYIK
jgi:2-iminobutanoate/2-iminopropanoate deaminase